MFWFSKKIRYGDTYACTAGDYVGSILTFIKEKEGMYGFISIPTMKNQWIPKEKFDIGLENNILEYVENLPLFVKRTLKKQFDENEKSIRLQSK